MGIVELAKSVSLLPNHGGDHKSDEYQGDNSKNVTLKERGNSQQYRIAKLKRDHPEIADRLEQGVFKSVSEAERAAV